MRLAVFGFALAVPLAAGCSQGSAAQSGATAPPTVATTPTATQADVQVVHASGLDSVSLSVACDEIKNAGAWAARSNWARADVSLNDAANGLRGIPDPAAQTYAGVLAAGAAGDPSDVNAAVAQGLAMCKASLHD